MMDFYLLVINIFINNCFELGGYCAATEWILLVSKLENYQICMGMLIIKFRYVHINMPCIIDTIRILLSSRPKCFS